MNGVTSLATRLGVHRSNLSTNGNSIWDWAQAGPGGTSKLPEQVACPPSISTPGRFSIRISSHIGEFLITSRMRRKKLSPDLQIVKQYPGTNWNRQLQHYSSTQGCLWTVVKENAPQMQNFKSYIWLITFSELRDGQKYGLTLVHGWLMTVWLDVQGLGKKKKKKGLE